MCCRCFRAEAWKRMLDKGVTKTRGTSIGVMKGILDRVI